MNQYIIVSKDNECYEKLCAKLMLDDPDCHVRRLWELPEPDGSISDTDVEYAVIKLKSREQREKNAEKENERNRKTEFPPICRVAEEKANLCSPKEETDQEHYVKMVLMYVHEHLGENVNLKNISSYLHITKNYISSLFSQKTGEQLKKYIIKQRMERAEHLLTESRMPIQDIAALVGYSSPSYFSKVFRLTFGTRPSDYRKYNSKNGTSPASDKRAERPPAAERRLTSP